MTSECLRHELFRRDAFGIARGIGEAGEQLAAHTIDGIGVEARLVEG